MPRTVSTALMLLAPLLYESDERGQTRRSLPPPRIVKERAGEDRRPVVEQGNEKLGRDRILRVTLESHEIAESVDGGLQLQLGMLAASSSSL